MSGIIGLVLRVARNRDGATAIEYAFLAAIIAMGIVGSATAIGTQLETTFTDVAAGFTP
jgi:pilus assembly protein Flp/PilA